MALRSKLLAGDTKLEAAAVSDPDHIMQGASGDHVKKIQLALNQLDDAQLSADGQFGGRTAAAVLKFKQKRDIVNRSYQTQADNIVGKMTMAALDAEMFASESKTQIEVDHCFCQLDEPQLDRHFSVRNLSVRGGRIGLRRPF
ncbi:peptidoglycan-binding domain-containing protein [Enterovirga sp. CN4-39]|uniref:peptidoglycan-binding domain-containing protein n=1 Tax=Enterovirga sp. CN4-39 TaxID=3400910 RepID=UPI003C10F75E